MNTLSLYPQTLIDKFNAGDYNGLAQDILEIFQFFEAQRVEEMNDKFTQGLELVVDVLLWIFCAPQFRFNNQLAAELIRQNTVFANMIRLTRFYNADTVLRTISRQPDNFIRILILYSPYCTVRFELEGLFKIQPYLTSLWIATVLKQRWRAIENVYLFVEEILNSPALKDFTLDDKYFPLMEDISFAYFDATYANANKDRALRDIINVQTRKTFKRNLKMGTDMKRILIISANMNRENSIYRCLAPLLYALKPEYHLTLFHHKPEENSDLDTRLFDDIKKLEVGINDSFTYEMLEQVLAGNYGIVLFSDVGLNRPSVIFSNLRLAPIQITTYGHPVTSGNSEIDYYIGGQAVEETNNPQRHFTEQLVLIPGLGVEPVHPTYQPTFPARKYDWLEIGLSWGDIKFIYPHLKNLKEILTKTKQRIRFNFIGINATRLTFLAAYKDLEVMFGAENIYVSPCMPNRQYMEAVEACDLLLDSFHFGSYNRIVDCLTLHKPVIALEGEKSYSRFASALLRQVGLEELVATTSQAYVEKSLRLIEDENWREEILQKIRGLDLNKKLFETGNAYYFKKAMDNIVAHHIANPKHKPEGAILIAYELPDTTIRHSLKSN